MGPYCTVAELAVAIRVTATPANTPMMQACIDAAGVEVDDGIDWKADDPPLETDDPKYALANRVNLLRAVEWWKANDAITGGGLAESGTLVAPRSSFSLAHGGTLMPLKRQWGIA